MGSQAPSRPAGQPWPPPGRVHSGTRRGWGKGEGLRGARGQNEPPIPGLRAGLGYPRAVPGTVGPAAGGRAAGSPASRLGALPSPPHVLRAGSSALTAATAVVSALFTQTGARGPGTGIPRRSHVS